MQAHCGEDLLLAQGEHLEQIKTITLGSFSLHRTRVGKDGAEFKIETGQFPDAPAVELQGSATLEDGRSLFKLSMTLLPPRPLLKGLEVIRKESPMGLPLQGSAMLIPNTAPVMVSALSGRPGRYPLGRAPKVNLRNADEPGNPVTIPQAGIRLTGRGQRLLASFKPVELLGTRSTGHLEIQVEDGVAGTSGWTPLPALFLELPVITSLAKEGEAWWVSGPVLDCIESTATSPEGPWEALKLSYRGSGQVAPTAPVNGNGGLFLKLYGWPELVLQVQAPVAKEAARTL